ncbi:MAG TPA: pseudouridine synthase, partial [Cytophagaceae bacterium]
MNLPQCIIFEDDHLLVVNKPCGLMVEPDRNGHPNLLQIVKAYIKSKRSFDQEIYAQHIHRLDRPVSGIILFAKQRQVLRNLSEQFAERRVKKFYQALTCAAPKVFLGTLEHWHRKEKKKAMLYDTEIP